MSQESIIGAPTPATLAALAPPTIIVARREPTRPAFAFPQESEALPVEAMPDQASLQNAPGPVPYTQFWNVGRDAQHAWPVRWLYQALAIPEWLSVAGWPFSSVGHTKAGALVTMPRGGMQPQATRSNINSPRQTSVGSMSAVYGPVTADINNMKLV